MRRKAAGIARRWWPLAAFLVVLRIAQGLWTSRYHPAGSHAKDHLASASVVFAMTFLVAALLWAITPEARRFIPLWLVSAVTVAGAFVVTAGNLRVINAIGSDAWNDEQAGRLGAGRPGFSSGHNIIENGAWITVGGTIVLALVLLQRRVASMRVAIVAILLSLVFPQHIVPGAGIVVLVGCALFAKRRALRAAT